jgi:hypothetical protein
MVQSVNRGFRLAEALSYFARRQTCEVAQNENFALVLGQSTESVTETLRSFEPDLLVTFVVGANLTERDQSTGETRRIQAANGTSLGSYF